MAKRIYWPRKVSAQKLREEREHRKRMAARKEKNASAGDKVLPSERAPGFEVRETASTAFGVIDPLVEQRLPVMAGQGKAVAQNARKPGTRMTVASAGTPKKPATKERRKLASAVAAFKPGQSVQLVGVPDAKKAVVVGLSRKPGHVVVRTRAQLETKMGSKQLAAQKKRNARIRALELKWRLSPLTMEEKGDLSRLYDERYYEKRPGHVIVQHVLSVPLENILVREPEKPRAVDRSKKKGQRGLSRKTRIARVKARYKSAKTQLRKLAKAGVRVSGRRRGDFVSENAKGSSNKKGISKGKKKEEHRREVRNKKRLMAGPPKPAFAKKLPKKKRRFAWQKPAQEQHHPKKVKSRASKKKGK